MEEIEHLLQVTDRYVDMGARFRVYDRIDGKAQPVEWLPEIWGGIYDRLTRRYVAPPTKIHEISLARAHVEFVMDDTPGILWDLFLGTPGSGKSEAVVRRALRKMLQYPNSTWGMLGPTDERRRVLWNKLLGEFLNPFGWVEKGGIKELRKEIYTTNGGIYQVLSAAIPSKEKGSAVQGRDNWREAGVDELQSCDDQSVKETVNRGRSGGMSYRVYGSATNQMNLPNFRMTLERFKQNPKSHIIRRITYRENPWVDPDFYEKQIKSQYSKNEWLRYIEVQDLPPDALVYSSFTYENNLRKRPPANLDCTRLITEKLLRRAADYVVGVDFGRVVNASNVLKCFIDPKTQRRQWWVVDEITSYHTLIESHARKIKQAYHPGNVVCIGDPHVNQRDIDKTGFAIFRKEGFDIYRPTSQQYIPIEERVSMMNRLLCDANGDSWLFVDVDEHGHPAAEKIVQAFLTEERQADGRTEGKKDMASDMSHWPCNVGYALWMFEKDIAKVQTRLRTFEVRH